NLDWAKQIGGPNIDRSFGITLDASFNVYTTGYFHAIADFDPDVSGVFNLIGAGYENVFVSKLDSAGNFVWEKGMGGTMDSFGGGQSIAVDNSGDVFLTGYFESQSFMFDSDSLVNA